MMPTAVPIVTPAPSSLPPISPPSSSLPCISPSQNYHNFLAALLSSAVQNWAPFTPATCTSLPTPSFPSIEHAPLLSSSIYASPPTSFHPEQFLAGEFDSRSSSPAHYCLPSFFPSASLLAPTLHPDFVSSPPSLLPPPANSLPFTSVRNSLLPVPARWKQEAALPAAAIELDGDEDDSDYPLASSRSHTLHAAVTRQSAPPELPNTSAEHGLLLDDGFSRDGKNSVVIGQTSQGVVLLGETPAHRREDGRRGEGKEIGGDGGGDGTLTRNICGESSLAQGGGGMSGSAEPPSVGFDTRLCSVSSEVASVSRPCHAPVSEGGPLRVRNDGTSAAFNTSADGEAEPSKSATLVSKQLSMADCCISNAGHAVVETFTASTGDSSTVTGCVVSSTDRTAICHTSQPKTESTSFGLKWMSLWLQRMPHISVMSTSSSFPSTPCSPSVLVTSHFVQHLVSSKVSAVEPAAASSSSSSSGGTRALQGPPPSLTCAAVHAEKRAVKNELRRHDMEFQRFFGHPPGKLDKEPLRPLYHYYDHLKQTLSQLNRLSTAKVCKLADNSSAHPLRGRSSALLTPTTSVPRPSSGSPPTASQPCSRPPPASSQIAHSTTISRSSPPTSSFITSIPPVPQPVHSQSTAVHSPSIPRPPVPSVPLRPQYSSLNCHPPHAVLLSTSLPATPIIHSTDSAVSDLSRMVGTAASSPTNINLASSLPPSHVSSVNPSAAASRSLSPLIQRLQRLKSQRVDLKKALAVYQKEFQKTQGRCVRLQKDILPVERQYRQYTQTKDDIKRLQEQISKITAGASKGELTGSDGERQRSTLVDKETLSRKVMEKQVGESSRSSSKSRRGQGERGLETGAVIYSDGLQRGESMSKEADSGAVSRLRGAIESVQTS
eukprot:GHVQ01015906.1.p1 GENE.GHVQ01015906.1~~GHVQ01015906.1.p1  ORF type:complete len:888 (+),score=171.98 GHVQ01015906.1:604-3267(+)